MAARQVPARPRCLSGTCYSVLRAQPFNSSCRVCELIRFAALRLCGPVSQKILGESGSTNSAIRSNDFQPAQAWNKPKTASTPKQSTSIYQRGLIHKNKIKDISSDLNSTNGRRCRSALAAPGPTDRAATVYRYDTPYGPTRTLLTRYHVFAVNY